MGKPWTWVSVLEAGHFRKGTFEIFIRYYFSEILSGEDSGIDHVFIDVDTEEVFTEGEASVPVETLLSWLPSVAIVDAWRSVHQN